MRNTQDIRDFIGKFRETTGEDPTSKEIAVALGYKSVMSVGYHLRKLKADGTLEGNLPSAAARSRDQILLALQENTEAREHLTGAIEAFTQVIREAAGL